MISLDASILYRAGSRMLAGLLVIAVAGASLSGSTGVNAQESDDDDTEESRGNLLTEEMDFTRIAPLISEDLGQPLVWNASFQTRPLKFTGMLDEQHFDAQIGVLLRSAKHGVVVHEGIGEIADYERARTLAPLVGPREILKRQPYEIVRFLLTPKSGGADAVAELVQAQLSEGGTSVFCGANDESLMICDFVSSIAAIRESVDAATPEFTSGSISLTDTGVNGEVFADFANELYEIPGMSSAEEDGVFIYRVETSRAEEAGTQLTQLLRFLMEEDEPSEE